MHVLIVSRGLPDARYPLNGIFEFDQAKALAKAGVQVTYFAVDLRSIRRKRKWGVVSETRDGVTCYSMNVPVGAVPKSVLLKVGTWALEKLYHHVFTETKPDLVHAHFTDYGYISAKLAETEHIPLVITEHSSAMNQSTIKKSVLSTARYAYSRAAAVIAVGNGLAKNIEEKTGVSCVVIPNIMAEEEFFRTKRKAISDGFGFVFSGNLISSKRPGLLLEAFHELLKKHSNVRLGIIGDGELRKPLEEEIAALGLSEHVRLYGRLTRAQMASEYENYNCFVLPSAWETFGVVYIEALAAGLPVIATRCGGPEDFVTSEVGLLIPVDDQKALVEAMETMIETAGQYNSRTMKDFVQARFSADAVTEKLNRLYSDTIEMKK